MKVQCDACERTAATVFCCADEAALCGDCDVEVHAANKLAGKHKRVRIGGGDGKLPLCDICQEKTAFIFCVEDRALFCRECDERIHVPGTLSGNHRRLLATGISVALSSESNNEESAKVKSSSKPSNKSLMPTKPKVQLMQQTSQAPIPPSAWSVDEFLQLSDFEPCDKKGPLIEFGEVDWFSDVGFFQDQLSNKSFAAAEVPEMRILAKPSIPAFYRTGKSTTVQKKPRLEIKEDEEFFTVPDLG